MTDIERKIADIIVKHYDEDENSYPYTDYRIYTLLSKFLGAITSQGEEHDILFFQYTENEETGNEYLQLFISSDDDMCQDFIYLADLTPDEQAKVVELFYEQMNEFGTELAIV